ncbi:MAG: inositol monophosphatase family protein [Acidilobaceae archaeon]
MSLTYDPEDLRRVAVKIAEETAGLLRDYACTSEYMANVRGETIVADKIAEDYIIDALRGENLRVKGISEERGFFGDGDLITIIDPLDGSSNYSHCISWASVSLAFSLDFNLSSVIAGAVAPVFYGNTFSFSRGKGCYHGGSPAMRFKDNKCLIFAYVEDPAIASTILDFIKSDMRDCKIRSLGSAALEICYTAIGASKLFIDARMRLRNVDVAAALGFIRECGGEAFNSRGEPLDSTITRVEVVGDVIASLDKTLALNTSKTIGKVRGLRV